MQNEAGQDDDNHDGRVRPQEQPLNLWLKNFVPAWNNIAPAKCTADTLARAPHVPMGLRYGATHLLTCRYTLVGLPFAPSSWARAGSLRWCSSFHHTIYSANFRVVTCAMPKVTLLSISAHTRMQYISQFMLMTLLPPWSQVEICCYANHYQN